MANTRSSSSARPSAVGPTLAVLIALVALFALFSRVWTDFLWFRELGDEQVFSTRLLTGMLLFVVIGLIMTIAVAFNLYFAWRLRPEGPIPIQAEGTFSRYQEVMTSRTKAFVLVPSLLMGALAGAAAVSEVEPAMAWWNAKPFGITDPYFNKDVSFFVFDLPWWQFVLGMVLAILLVCTFAAALVHLVTGSLRVTPIRLAYQGQADAGSPPQIEVRNPFGPRAQAHLSVLLGLVMVAYGVRCLIDRYAFATLNNELFTGVNYTDANVRITAKLVVAIIAFIIAVVFFANAKLRRWAIPGAALVLMIVSSLIISTIYPGLVQRFSVKPDEPIVERPYIAKQIEATRQAYGINKVEIQQYSAETTTSAGQLRADAEALPGIRLMDPAVIAPTFEQLQQVRSYYSFPSVLDVDRYTIDGQQTDAIVAAREIDLNGVPDPSWNNIHTVYTHGYAMVAAYGNRRQPSGEPSWIVGDIPPVGKLATHRAGIYYGQMSTEYTVVGAPEGTEPWELDTPGGSDGGGEQKTTYSGQGGVPIGNPVVRALYAMRFTDINMLLSNRVNEESRILYDRQPSERVKKVAPWLTVDSDPYPAIVDGGVKWIIDGYTTSNSYPNSQRVDLKQATSDSSTARRGEAIAENLNYIRNSVKAVVDAYDGTVDLYVWDETDPVLQTWMSVYPELLRPKSEISPDTLAHMRYPQDLFKVQRQILGRYHTISPDTWYQQNDLWQVPADPRQKDQKEPTYYLSIKWPGDESPLFSQTAVFVPNGRENLAAYFAVVADASSPDYGKMRVLRLSDTQQISGPGQTFNAITTDQAVAERLRPFLMGGSADTIYGNLLTLPVGGGLMYVEPIYTQRKDNMQGSSGSYPVLRFVVVRFGENIAIGDTLQEALDKVFKGDAGADTGEGGAGAVPTPGEGSGEQTPTGTGPEAAKAALAAAAAAYEAADRALQAGDLAEYQKQINQARAKIQEAQASLG